MGKRQLKRNSLSLFLRFLAGGMFLFIFMGGASLSLVMANALEKPGQPSDPEKNEAQQSSLAELLETPFSYQCENRSNPFTPFIKKQIKSVITSGGEDIPAEILTGMQLFEPGQLRLVSIVFADSRTFAMVQDSVGQGYIISKGTKIGRRGVVSDILANLVVVKQWSLTFSGQKRYKNIEMVLRKEGE